VIPGIAITVSIFGFLYALGLNVEFKKQRERLDFLEEVLKHLGTANKQIMDNQRGMIDVQKRLAVSLEELQRGFN